MKNGQMDGGNESPTQHCLENHEKIPVRLIGIGIWARDLPNASLVRYHGAMSLGSYIIVTQPLYLFIYFNFFKLVIHNRFDCKGLIATVICWEWETLGETLGVIFHCHLLGYFGSEAVHHFVINNMVFRSCETLNLYISSGIWEPTRYLSLKITNSLVIFRLRKPLITLTRLAGHGIWTRDLPNASLVRYHGATSLGNTASYNILWNIINFCWSTYTLFCL